MPGDPGADDEDVDVACLVEAGGFRRGCSRRHALNSRIATHGSATANRFCRTKVARYWAAR